MKENLTNGIKSFADIEFKYPSNNPLRFSKNLL